MISAALPNTELLEAVKIETGYPNIRNLENRLKILATDAEKKLGYNSALVLKKTPYENDGLNYNGSDLWLPKDCWEFATIYDDDSEIDSSNYTVTGDYVFFRKGTEPSKPIVYYHALTFDGFGWPLMSRNHKDAIVAYIVWKLYVPKAFQSGNRSDRALIKDYEQDWRDERDAAIGMDVMPGSQQEWRKAIQIWNNAGVDLEESKNCFVKESEYALAVQKECVLREVEKVVTVYHWQYPDRVTNISEGPTIDVSYLDDNTTKETLETMIVGKTITYTEIGRISFALQNVDEGEYQIYDVLNQRVDDIVFESYYNSVLKLQIFVSKEFYSISNIFFKLVKAV